MHRNVLANHPGIDPQRFDDATIAALHVAFPEASLDPPAELIATLDDAPAGSGGARALLPSAGH